MKTKEFFRKNPYTGLLLVFLAVVLIILTIANAGTFWTVGTWKGIVMQFPEYGVMAVGLMFAFILGQMDMSFVMLGNFATVLGSLYLAGHVTPDMSKGQQFGHMFVMFLIVMAVGALGGVINGLLISKLGIPPVVATIGMQMVWLGFSKGITNGKSISIKEVPLYTELGHSSVLGFIPWPLFIFILMFIFGYLVLNFTSFGKKVYMCGTNMKAGKFSGINTDRLIIVTLVVCDMICCIGSMLMVSTLNSAKADNGDSYTMTIVLVLCLAGILPDGGIGKVGNLIFSILIIQLIKSGVNMFPNLNSFVANFIYGGLLVVVLILSTYMTADGFSFMKKKPAKKAEAKA